MSTMMQTPLTLPALLDRASIVQPSNIVVTKTDAGYTQITYREHQIRTYQLASALTKFGVNKGDRIATFCWNSARHLQCYHAIPCIGCVVHPINIRLNAKELSYIISHAGDRVIVVDTDLLPALEGVDPAVLAKVDLILVCGLDEKPGGWTSTLKQAVDWDAFLATGETYFEWPEIDENDAMGLCYTSGTTGNPKGVAYSHRSTYLHTLANAGVEALGITSTDVCLPVVPMFHALAWGVPFITLMLGTRTIMLNRFLAPEPILECFSDWGVTWSSGVPTIWQGVRAMLQAKPSLGDKLKLRALTCGGSSPPPEMMRWYWDNFKAEFIQGWGMTETNPLCTLSRQVSKLKHLDWDVDARFDNVVKAGLLLPGLEMKIVDSDDMDRVLPRDGEAAGELLVRGPWITGTYFNVPPESVASKFHKGWLVTGDIASIDPEGYMVIRDRSKDLIKSGGEWISSVDMENHICALPAVQMCCVVAVPHPRWQERPVALLILGEGQTVTKQAVIDHCKTKFAKFQLPDDVLFVDDIAMTSTGKMSKKDMRDRLKKQNYVLPSLAKAKL